MTDNRWRSMSSAPREGSRVLVWFAGIGPEVASFRLPILGEPQCEGHYVREWRTSSGRWATPTHWMPLPEDPAMKEGKR